MGPAIAVSRFLENLGMTTAKANQVVLEAFDPAKTDEVIAMIEKNYGKGTASRFAKRIANTVGTQERTLLNVNKVVAIGATPTSDKKSEDKAAVEEPQASLSPAYDVPYIAKIIRGHEGLGDNPKSSAVGAFQFIDSTLASMYNKEHLDSPITDKEARAMRADGRISADDIERYGVQFTEDNVAKDVLSPGAMAANANIHVGDKYLKDFTVQDLRDWAENSMYNSYTDLKKRGEIE
jgi:hypothetical protein